MKEIRLLDAAHIVADPQAHGEAVVSNGLSLCSIHHRAFSTRTSSASPPTTRCTSPGSCSRTRTGLCSTSSRASTPRRSSCRGGERGGRIASAWQNASTDSSSGAPSRPRGGIRGSMVGLTEPRSSRYPPPGMRLASAAFSSPMEPKAQKSEGGL
ncbi:MAG: HNH endonuclease [Gaiellaceae bacterium]